LLHIHLGLGAALSDLGLIDITEGTDVVACDALTNGIIWQALLAAVLAGIVGILGWPPNLIDDVSGDQCHRIGHPILYNSTAN
jgi:hypothetical protein